MHLCFRCFFISSSLVILSHSLTHPKSSTFPLTPFQLGRFSKSKGIQPLSLSLSPCHSNTKSSFHPHTHFSAQGQKTLTSNQTKPKLISITSSPQTHKTPMFLYHWDSNDTPRLTLSHSTV